MAPENVTFREARPTREDGLAFARYLDQVSHGFFRLRLGDRCDDIVARAFVKRGHHLSFENTLMLEHEGRVCGMASGFAGAHRDQSSEPFLRRAAGGLALRLRVTAAIFAPLLGLLSTVGDDEFYLQTMFIEPELRGGGVGTRLLEEAKAYGRRAGATRLVLDVAAGNADARRLYERQGWTIESTWPRRLPPVFMRMSRPLDAS